MKPRILSVDNHEDTLALLEQLLSLYGYESAAATSVSEGARLARSEDFDLFLIDHRLADGTGKELCRRIREFDEETPILFFSGAHPAMQQEALSCGAQGYVLKPDFEGLRREIRRALEVARR